MEQATIIGLDLAKRVFQAHGATVDGKVAFRKKLSRVGRELIMCSSGHIIYRPKMAHDIVSRSLAVYFPDMLVAREDHLSGNARDRRSPPIF
jgi:hypothetical protein